MNNIENAENINRRDNLRSECSQAGECLTSARKRYQAEVLDVSLHGAKLIVDANVKVGDFLRLACAVVSEVCEGTGTVVRWTKSLPGGRKLIGVQTLRAAYALPM